MIVVVIIAEVAAEGVLGVVRLALVDLLNARVALLADITVEALELGLVKGRPQ